MARTKPKSFYKVLSEEIRKESKLQTVLSPMDFGGTILEMRKKKNFSAKQLCLNTEGLDPKTLNAIEKGRIRNPSIRTLQALAAAFKVTVGDLFKQAELKFESNLYVGNQKGVYQIDFHNLGVRVVSFTPFVKDFFCGKVILGSHKRLEHTLLQHPLPIYISLLVGRIDAEVENKQITLREGDNLFLNGILKHSFYNPLEREAAFLLVTAPSFI